MGLRKLCAILSRRGSLVGALEGRVMWFQMAASMLFPCARCRGRSGRSEELGARGLLNCVHCITFLLIQIRQDSLSLINSCIRMLRLGWLMYVVTPDTAEKNWKQGECAPNSSLNG